VIDLTSALYLGFRHSSEHLSRWSQLTTGRPSALVEPAISRAIAKRLARLIGTESATLESSTLHLFWDFFGMLSKDRRCVIYLDNATYAIPRWGVERASGRGTRVISFAHHNPIELAGSLAHRQRGTYPVIVSDGFCTDCGSTAPLDAYQKLARRYDGLLVVDDSQALGVLGAGGGGSMKYLGAPTEHFVSISSLAKGFGAPIAVLTASDRMVREFRRSSETAVYCSPPSQVALLAAESALSLNDRMGDRIRNRLRRNTLRFRARLKGAGVRPLGGAFPVQTIVLDSRAAVTNADAKLHRAGILAVPRQLRSGQPALSFVVTARHQLRDLDFAATIIATAISPDYQVHFEPGGGSYDTFN